MMRVCLLLPLTLAASASAKIWYAGVDESSGEFGVYSANAANGTGLSGTFSVDYAFLNQTTADIWVDQNYINLFRVAFLLERTCPEEYGLGSKFNETYFGCFNDASEYITIMKGAYAILDPHNYMRYNDFFQQPSTGSIIGNTSDPSAASTAQFQTFWQELASRYVDNEKVIFGIMNEPHDMPTSLVLQNDRAVINGIRASGAKQLILALGNGYTGRHAWNESSQMDTPSADYMAQLVDPMHNTAIDIHEYLDYDFSGQHLICNQSFPANLAFFTSWLKENKIKALVFEFGGDHKTVCCEYLTQAVEYMPANEEYIGWSAWAAGPLWGTNVPRCNDGEDLGSLEPGSTAAGGSPSL